MHVQCTRAGVRESSAGPGNGRKPPRARAAVCRGAPYTLQRVSVRCEHASSAGGYEGLPAWCTCPCTRAPNDLHAARAGGLWASITQVRNRMLRPRPASAMCHVTPSNALSMRPPPLPMGSDAGAGRSMGPTVALEIGNRSTPTATSSSVHMFCYVALELLPSIHAWLAQPLPRVRPGSANAGAGPPKLEASRSRRTNKRRMGGGVLMAVPAQAARRTCVVALRSPSPRPRPQRQPHQRADMLSMVAM